MYQITCLIDAGAGNHGNDDRCYIGNSFVSDGLLELDDQPYAFAGVCDGVGGEAFGNEAAEAVARYMASQCSPNMQPEIIEGLIEKANQIVLRLRQQDSAHSQMSSTIAGIVVDGDNMVAFNVGDSRVYRYREPYIARLSKDHSAVETARDLGLEPKPGQEHVITEYLGSPSHKPNIFDGTGRAFEDDVYLLCSDGICDVVTCEDFETVLQSGQTLSKMCHSLVDLAMKKGSEDNLSVIIVRRK